MYGKKIKEYLDEKGIKYSFVAQETGISIKTLSAILNLKRKLTVEEYMRICEVLNLSIDYFAKKIKNVS